MTADKVFISYPHDSKVQMLELLEDLAGRFPIWKDSHYILPPDKLSDVLLAGIRDSYCCVLLLTEHTEKSSWCMQEAGAFWEAGKQIIVYKKADVPVPALFAGTRVANNLDELVRGLDRIRRLVIEEEQHISSHGLPFVRNVFPFSRRARVGELLNELAEKAREIKLIGTGLNILEKDSGFTDSILRRAAKNDCRLEIYLGDPYSPAVETRLIQENLGTAIPVSIGKKGIIDLAKDLSEQWANYPAPKPDLHLRFFTHGPTFALLRFDDEYFFYPYGCMILGDKSPVFQFSKSAPEHQEALSFFHEEFERVKRISTSYSRVTSHGKLRMNVEEPLFGLAVYFVPKPSLPAEKPGLYEFGTDVLGYDIRNSRQFTSEFKSYVGAAKGFGFHLTLCDALYFLTPGEVDTAIAEAEFVASEFPPFRLTNLTLTKEFPDPRSIALVPKDSSGTLEALHHEFVQRINRRAVASNYTLGLAAATRDNDRDRSDLLITRYLAPYILNRFRPHFTLLTDVPQKKQEQLYLRLIEKLNNSSLNVRVVNRDNQPTVVIGRPVEVKELAILSRRYCAKDASKSTEWVLEKKTIHLGATGRTKAAGAEP